LKHSPLITYLSIKKQMLWQLDNDQAAGETRAHNVKASAILSVPSEGMKIMMIMDAKKILMMKIMMKMISLAEDTDRKKTTTKTTATTIMTMKILIAEEDMKTGAEIGKVANNKAGAPVRDLAA